MRMSVVKSAVSARACHSGWSWGSVGADLENVEHNNGASSDQVFVAHPLEPNAVFGLVGFHDGSDAKEAQDARELVKGAKEHSHPAILADMADGLAPGPNGVDVGHLAGVQDRERRFGDALGRDVDVAASQRC